MSHQLEAVLEKNLIRHLASNRYSRIIIKDLNDLENNFKKQLEKNNKIELTDDEFKRIRNHLDGGSQFVKSKKLRDKYELENISPGGAGRNRVMSKKDFPEIKVNIPTLTEQTKIANFLTKLNSKIKFVEKELSEAKEFKKGLLQKMFV